ncbi:MAG: glutamate--cysteine ligase [bacterium]|nr:glutamate--cysteine ligase [Gammaproteobacteria bacterium]HIL98933.1 glutamate--cysteine ligase [Pseudomonadales bacterium]
MTQNTEYKKSLEALLTVDPQALLFNHGIERESLRVDDHGNLARAPHPSFLGSKLSHPTITTDFSEAQLELITPVSQSVSETLQTLTDIHRFVYSGLKDESLWSASMPCVLQGESKIPLAYYGTSNLGKLKTTYRNGLGNRYGRSMQTICAVHYNFSFTGKLWEEMARIENTENTTDYRNQRYFDVMRNFRRFSWLAVYLSGASPAVCNSFVKGREHNLDPFDEGSLYKAGATSLRNGNLGYQSDAQSDLMNICYNSLDNYVGNIARAVITPFGSYTDIGSRKDGEYLQVNDCILQSEAEFYTTVRAKRVPAKGANFLQTLLDEGVEYIEVRLLDVNPYQPLGIDDETIHFLNTFLLYCLLIDSPSHDDDLCQSVKSNVNQVVHQGRDPSTLLNDQGRQRTISQWGQEILTDLLPLAARLDAVAKNGSDAHQQSILRQQQKLRNPDLTPSGRILQDMQSESVPFFRFAMNQTLAHKTYFQEQPLSKAELEYFTHIASQSIADQNQIEQLDEDDFDTYLNKIREQYLAIVS